eukprot:Platyproteum_vivax@DN4254_c0_g1_i1.p1
MDHFHKGNSHFVEEDYDKAHEAFSASIKEDASCSMFWGHRAATRLRTGDLEGVLEDCNAALAIDTANPVVYLHKGHALFQLGQLSAAKATLQKAQKCQSQDENSTNTHLKKQINRWLNRCDGEMAGSVLPLGSLHTTNVAVPQNATATNGTAVKNPTDQIQQASSSESKKPASDKPYQFNWIQHASQVIVTLYAKNVAEGSCELNVGGRSMLIKGLEKGDFELNDLFEEVTEQGSSIQYYPSKIEAILAKNTETNWPALEKKDVKPLDSKLQYPTSKKKDWATIEKEVDEELKDDKNEGEEAINKLFQDIYARGDEDTRRAMIKSFQTSGGTVLSTNWKDVKTKDYEKDLSAPAGQEVRKWEK